MKRVTEQTWTLDYSWSRLFPYFWCGFGLYPLSPSGQSLSRRQQEQRVIPCFKNGSVDCNTVLVLLQMLWKWNSRKKLVILSLGLQRHHKGSRGNKNLFYLLKYIYITSIPTKQPVVKTNTNLTAKLIRNIIEIQMATPYYFHFKLAMNWRKASIQKIVSPYKYASEHFWG